MPNRRETYMSPVLYTPISGGETYILFGSGGETVDGGYTEHVFEFVGF